MILIILIYKIYKSFFKKMIMQTQFYILLILHVYLNFYKIK